MEILHQAARRFGVRRARRAEREFPRFPLRRNRHRSISSSGVIVRESPTYLLWVSGRGYGKVSPRSSFFFNSLLKIRVYFNNEMNRFVRTKSICPRKLLSHLSGKKLNSASIWNGSFFQLIHSASHFLILLRSLRVARCILQIALHSAALFFKSK